MIPFYLHEMNALKISDEDLWNELKRGCWVVNRNQIPFCALGADEALEQQNRKLKVLGGLVGITQKPATLARFFLSAPELTRISEEAETSMFNQKIVTPSYHHNLNTPTTCRHARNIKEFLRVLKTPCNPFTYDGSDLVCLTTSFNNPKRCFSNERSRTESV